MQENTLHLALEILNPKKDGVQKLKSKLEDGIHLFEKKEDGKTRLFIYPINGDLVDFLTQIAEDLGIDTVRFSINWIDTESKKVYPSQLIKKIEKVETFNETFELFDTTEVEDYITSNHNVVAQEEATLVEDGSGGTAPSSATVGKEDKTEEGNNDLPAAQESNAQKLLKEYEAKTFIPNKVDSAKDNVEEQPQASEEVYSPEVTEPVSQSDELLDDIPDSFENNSNKETDPEIPDDDLLNEIPDDFDNDDQYQSTLSSSDDDKESDDILSKDEMSAYIFDDEPTYDEPDQGIGAVISDNLSADPADPLMAAAIEMFNKSTVGNELPVFDHKTQDLVRPSYVQAINHIVNAKAKAINDIYGVLKETHDREYNDALDNAIADAKDEHDKNVKQIRQNLQTEIDQLQQNIKDEYDKRKREAGQSYLNEFYAKYDQEHLHEIAENVSEQSKSLSTKATTDISIEDNDLYKYINQVKDSIFKHVTENADIETFIQNYKNTVNTEKDHLLDEVKATRDENQELKKKVKDLQSALEIQKQTADSRIKAEVAQQVNKATYAFRKQVEDSDKRRQAAEEAAEKEKAKVEEFHNKNQEIMQQLSDMTKNLSEIQLADKIKKDTTREILGNNPVIPQAPVQYQQPQVQPTQPQQPASPTAEKSSKKKLSVTDKVLIGVATLFAGVSIFTGTMMFNNMNSAAKTEQTSVAPSGTNITSDKVTSSNESDSFVYTTKDGKKYKVTKDSKNSGHYVDGDGNYHTVLFNNK